MLEASANGKSLGGPAQTHWTTRRGGSVETRSRLLDGQLYKR
jgi:hypothetical protein